MSAVYKAEKYTFNMPHYIIQHPEKGDVELSRAEAYILKKMLDNLNIVCNKNELEDIGWEGNPVSTSSLTVVIASLRKKTHSINDFSIRNIPRKGYFISTSLIIEKIGVQSKKTPSPKNSSFYTKFKKIISVCIYTFNILMVILFIIIGLFVSIQHDYLSCQKLNNKTLCSIGTNNFSTLSLLDDIDDGQVILKTPENTIILDEGSNILMSIGND